MLDDTIDVLTWIAVVSFALMIVLLVISRIVHRKEKAKPAEGTPAALHDNPNERAP